MRSSPFGIFLVILGLLLLIGALGLTGYNLWEEKQAADTASNALDAILDRVEANRDPEATAPSTESTAPGYTQPLPTGPAASVPSEPAPTEPIPTEPEIEIPDYLRDPTVEMPTVEHNGQTYIGVVEVPVLGLRLPVISQWTYPRLKIAPCRYQGSAYTNDLIIMAHNYKSHFGKLLNLRPGDDVYFTDMAGNAFRYQVIELETLAGNAVEDMSAGDWDLTLFTCTLGGKTRVTVRCERAGG